MFKKEETKERQENANRKERPENEDEKLRRAENVEKKNCTKSVLKNTQNGPKILRKKKCKK